MKEGISSKSGGRPFEAAVVAFEAHASDAVEAPHESLVRKGTITKEGLRKLASLPHESSLRDKGEDHMLASGTERGVHDFQGNVGSLGFELGVTFNYEFETSKAPLHTHPVLHFPSFGDIAPVDFGQLAHQAGRDSKAPQFQIAWIATTKGLIAYRRALIEEVGRLDYMVKLLQADNKELFDEHGSAMKKKDFSNPVHAEVAEKMLALYRQAGIVLADIPWSDPRADVCIDTLNRKQTPEEVIRLLKDDHGPERKKH